MPQTTTVIGETANHGQIIALDSRRPEQVVSNKQYLKILQVTDLLSRHLHLNEIMTVFSREVMALVPFDGMRYSCQQLKSPITHGETEGHNLHYHLTLQQMEVGDLTFYRAQPFGTNEVCQIEDLLCALVYPLRNALMYHRAITSAYRDPLTNINNRAAMDKFLPREIGLAKRHQHDLSMMIMDLDGFKAINDQYGHDAGDRLLQTVCVKIISVLRDTDMLFRYGGDEFVVALPYTDIQGALDAGDRILHSIQNLSANECPGGASIGISIGLSMLLPEDDFQSLFKRVDQALYQAKIDGKNRLVVAE
ncbi:MAG: GGDEF domain-containing protein [Gammaproteobacteria bacterium]|nr:GGDEF domain-containing protein [Gammaproteobacteria bacterium]